MQGQWQTLRHHFHAHNTYQFHFEKGKIGRSWQALIDCGCLQTLKLKFLYYATMHCTTCMLRADRNECFIDTYCAFFLPSLLLFSFLHSAYPFPPSLLPSSLFPFLPSPFLPPLPPFIFLFSFLPPSPLLSPFQGQAALIKEAVDNMGDAPPALFDMLGEGVDVKDLDTTLTVVGSATSSKRGGKVGS